MWLWMGIGAAAMVVALATFVIVTAQFDRRSRTRRAMVRDQRYMAEAAMVRTVQNTIADMFNTVRPRR